MAKSNPSSHIELSLTITITEAEVRAFDAIMGYGTDSFLRHFYEHMGTSYLKPHEAGFRALFDTMRPQCRSAISRIDAARQAFDTANYEVRKKVAP